VAQLLLTRSYIRSWDETRVLYDYIESSINKSVELHWKVFVKWGSATQIVLFDWLPCCSLFANIVLLKIRIFYVIFEIGLYAGLISNSFCLIESGINGRIDGNFHFCYWIRNKKRIISGELSDIKNGNYAVIGALRMIIQRYLYLLSQL